MGKIVELQGQIFGRLTVLKKTDARSKLGRVKWLCKCECGNEKLVGSKELINGDTNSCGCLKLEGNHFKADTVGEITKPFWYKIEYGAKLRNLQFLISREEAWELFLRQNRKCALSGVDICFAKFSGARRLPSRGRNFSTASLDRIDNAKGYIQGNIQWLHKDVNKMKNTHTQDSFMRICQQVASHNQNSKKKPTIVVSGGFDPVHVGHCKMFLEAAAVGEVIVVVNSDDWLMRKKGYIFMPWNERKEIIESFRGVIKVEPVDDRDGTVCEALARLKPDYFANGGDRKEENTPENEICRKLGIEQLFNVGGGKIQSSSWLVNKVPKKE